MDCPIDSCGRPVVAAGLCAMHYQRHRRTGSTTLAKAPGLPRAHLPWRVPSYLLDVIRHAAELEGMEPSDWLETAILAALPWERMAE